MRLNTAAEGTAMPDMRIPDPLTVAGEQVPRLYRLRGAPRRCRAQNVLSSVDAMRERVAVDGLASKAQPGRQ
jgi:hypothetical protein